MPGASRFDAASLELLGRVQEIRLETTSLSGERTHRTIIWIVTAGDEAFIRSVRGSAGRWYREALQRPEVVVRAQGASIASSPGFWWRSSGICRRVEQSIKQQKRSRTMLP